MRPSLTHEWSVHPRKPMQRGEIAHTHGVEGGGECALLGDEFAEEDTNVIIHCARGACLDVAAQVHARALTAARRSAAGARG